MSRSRWAVLLCTPLIAAAAGAVAPVPPPAGTLAGGLPEPGSLGSCPPSVARAVNAARRGTPLVAWWRQDPGLDPAGTLTSWLLTVVGSDGVARAVTLPPASIVTGPSDGRVIASSDDGVHSVVRIVEADAGCSRALEIGAAVARRAIADPTSDGVLVHLLDRESRADLGVWRVGTDGRPPVRLLVPLGARDLALAGIERVWATDLRASADGTRLAAQSCDPEACLTRVLDLRDDTTWRVAGDQGELLGFTGERLVTLAHCHDRSCPVLAWTRDGGAPQVLLEGSLGAGVAADGTLLASRRDPDGMIRALAVDTGTAEVRDLGPLDPDARPTGGADSLAGAEAGPGHAAFLRGNGEPALFTTGAPTDPKTLRRPEVQR